MSALNKANRMGHKEEKLTLYELRVIGVRAVEYIAEVDEE